MAFLQFDHVSFTYPDRTEPVLREVSFSMEEGEYLAVCGESGCGKTTLLRMAKPELRPAGTYQGTVRYQGVPVEELDRETSALKIGFVQQNPENQIVTDYVWHELVFGLENMALPVGTIRRRVSEMASFFGMEDWFHKKTCELSGGQKQILNLASIMAMDPELLILDEPTSMLDPLAASNFLQMVSRINRELGVAVLLCEHRLEEVFQTADEVLLMKAGQVLWKDGPDHIAEYLQQDPERSRICYGLPAAVRIFGALREENLYPAEKKLPLSIRDAGKELRKIPAQKDYIEKTLTQEPKQDPVIRARELWFRYERKSEDILRSLDLTLYRGEILALLGGNGAGKSTFLKNIAGILKPQRGRITRAEGMKLAMLPQSPQALFHFDTVREEFLEIGTPQETERMADFLELSEKLDVHPYDLSGGEMQRAALGKLLLRKADILLLDEPTKGLDAYLKQSLGELLQRLSKENITILLVTHDLDFAACYAGRCGLLFDGQVISEDEPHRFFSGNRFYTTAAGMIAGTQIAQAITCEEVVKACQNDASSPG